MTDPLIGGKIFSVNPEANRLHETGLRAELDGNFVGAHLALAAARQILTGMPATMDTVVQMSRITRDDGFTDVRAAIAHSNPDLLDRARMILGRSVEDMGPLVSGVEVLETERQQPHGTPKKARRELFAEHGATVSLLGRMATVRQVMLGIDSQRDTEAARHARNDEQRPYGLAHDFLRMGSNGYYRVSNAMTGARQERLNGRLRHMGVWLGRAAVGLAWTAVRDRSNFKAAARTFGGRLRHLRSHKTAAASVLVKP